MLPLVYKPGSTAPVRLPTPAQARSRRDDPSPTSHIVLGAFLCGAGIVSALAGFRVINPATLGVKAPAEAFTAAGAALALLGLFAWEKAWRDTQSERRHQQLRRQHPNEPALTDYEWDPAGARSQLHQQALRATMVAVLFCLFIAPFNYLLFKEEVPLLMSIVVGAFDALCVFTLGNAGVRWGRAFKFGQAELRFDRFPCSTREPVRLTWIAPSGCSGAATGGFTLRAIVEWMETHGSRKSRQTRVVHEQRWCASWVLESPTLITPGMNCELVFDLPPDAPSTAMRAARPLFWELEVSLNLPGLDFKDTYLVPIYGPRRHAAMDTTTRGVGMR